MKFLIILFLVFSNTILCAQTISGAYTKKGKDYIYALVLTADNNFTFAQEYFEVRSDCTGRWSIVADTILLKCSDAKLEEKLQSGYMNVRERKLKLLKNGNLKLDGIILKRAR